MPIRYTDANLSIEKLDCLNSSRVAESSDQATESSPPKAIAVSDDSIEIVEALPSPVAPLPLEKLELSKEKKTPTKWKDLNLQNSLEQLRSGGVKKLVKFNGHKILPADRLIDLAFYTNQLFGADLSGSVNSEERNSLLKKQGALEVFSNPLFQQDLQHLLRHENRVENQTLVIYSTNVFGGRKRFEYQSGIIEKVDRTIGPLIPIIIKALEGKQ